VKLLPALEAFANPIAPIVNPRVRSYRTVLGQDLRRQSGIYQDEKNCGEDAFHGLPLSVRPDSAVSEQVLQAHLYFQSGILSRLGEEKSPSHPEPPNFLVVRPIFLVIFAVGANRSPMVRPAFEGSYSTPTLLPMPLSRDALDSPNVKPLNNVPLA